MKEENHFCPILKRVWKDTMQLAKDMGEIEDPAHEGRVDSRRLLGPGSPAPETASRQEETGEPALPDLLREEGSRHQTPERMFDLTKGRFPCYRK
jgi:hypothetical protein